MAGNDVSSGVLDIFYRNSNEIYLHMPFTNLLYEGKDLVVRNRDGLYKMAEFTIHAADVFKVDLSKREDKKVIFHTPRFYIVMAAL